MKLHFSHIIALAGLLLSTACVEDKVFEGPSTIESVSVSKEAPTSDDDVTVTATISGIQKVTSVTLNYTVNSNSQSVEMSQAKENVYTATIPAQADKSVVSYTVTVVNNAGFKVSSNAKEYTVGDEPIDFSQLVLNELYGAAATDDGKFIELYNKGDKPIKLKGVEIKKDEEAAWSGIDGEVIPAKGFFAIIGAKGTTERGFSSGFSAKKSVLVELFDPNGNKLDSFQRGEKGTGWGGTSLPAITGSWSRCPDGTGAWKVSGTPTANTKNAADGATDDTSVVQ